MTNSRKLGTEDSYGHPETASMLEVDGRAPAAARADDDHFPRLAPQGLDVLEINRQQRLKHRSLSLSQRPPLPLSRAQPSARWVYSWSSR